MEPSSIFKSRNNLSVQEHNAKYKHIISTLSETTDGWALHEKSYKYQDFWCTPLALERLISAQEHFAARPSDIITCGHPKSGTTWLKALCFAILTRTQFLNSSANPLLTQLPHDVAPNIENLFHDGRVRDPDDLPLWPTHIPYASLPKSVLESNCKIVYILRNPKDVVVSLWHFISRIRGSTTENFPLEEAFERFCKGQTPYGPYWDHVLGYWKASLQFPDKILFIKYEDLLNDAFHYVKRLAEFMGRPFSAEEEEQGSIEKIVELCGFENLSNLEVNKSRDSAAIWPVKIENNVFFRKGKIGDWKNYLTDEMVSQIDKITEERFKNFGLSFNTKAL